MSAIFGHVFAILGTLEAIQILVEEVLSFKMNGVTSKLDKNQLQNWGKCEATSNFYMIMINFTISPNH